ncbi:aminodeoxychorismate/anthranilate synthase component II [Bacillus sp. AGMB 02131]|uniref:Aminodeoxychorismate/anthranilate synthase component II n=1 Tax=Peribacillus faecalis TaxID=2772559 RepID=A0A927D1V4_9BACI|nr:aminodeoxychorismate/anthranilate synthase component II [Peribacillus faecalis]MBD3109499.1 aminodeoxychorismate/anthranilate synthase component II [Peribacillus faecalis]
MILLIDNYDSFTFNLYQQVSALGEDVVVIRNDKLTVEEVLEMNPKAIVLSPGPGRPEQAGIMIDLIKQCYDKIPILGICLGHQAIASAFGGNIIRAKSIMHGKVSAIRHFENNVFEGLTQQIQVMRYHSLAAEKETLPKMLEVIAFSEDGEIMALAHREHLVVGIQFHPESIGTKEGNKIVANFLRKCKEAVL